MVLLESVFVAMVLHVGRQSSVPVGGSAAEPAPRNVVPVSNGRLSRGIVDSRSHVEIMPPLAELGQIKAWKLFCLVPKMLLNRPRNTGSVGRDELARRVTQNSNRVTGSC